MLHWNRSLMQAHPLAQQCWANLQDAQSCSPAAEGQSLFYSNKLSFKNHEFCACLRFERSLLVWTLKQIKSIFFHYKPVFFISYITKYSCSFFFFFFSQGHLFFSLCMQPIPHFLFLHLVWLWGLGCRDNRGHRRLCSICKVSVVASTLRVWCRDGEGPSHTATSHSHRVRNVGEFSETHEV